ncbi:MAG: hypothetical protein C0596_02375 [Marinilabiliales bacterium]|nr:MAG: hypothetical protein C0596_02375 [Marinilabiliales bacterium]
MIKVCENCGKEFTCAHNSTCWCLKYTVSRELSDYLKKSFKDCLCEDCLSYFIKNDKEILTKEKTKCK